MITRRHRPIQRALMLVTVACTGLAGGLLGVPVGPAPTPADAAAPQRPVLLVGGTFTAEPALDNRVKPWLESQGYDVYTTELATMQGLPPSAEALIDLVGAAYGLRPEEVSGAGTASMDVTALEPHGSGLAVARAVDEVLAATGAAKVDIIAHSQGGPVARWYIKNLGGASKVATLISVGGPEWGVPPVTGDPLRDILVNGACLYYDAPVCSDAFHGLAGPLLGPSPFFYWLNFVGDPTPGAVSYYHLWGSDDAPQLGLRLPGATSVAVPQFCRVDGQDYVVNHVEELDDPVVRNLMEAALERGAVTPADCFR